MQKHIEDDGDLAVLINNDGELLLMCLHCKTTWIGKFSSIRKAARVDVASALTSLERAPLLLERLDVDLQAFR